MIHAASRPSASNAAPAIGPVPAFQAPAAPSSSPEATANDRATLAAALLAIDPGGLGGIVLRAAAGASRDGWFAYLRHLLPPSMLWRRLPPGMPASRLDGGLDVTATLAASRPIYEAGLLANGGTIVVPMAERLDAGMAGRLAFGLDGAGDRDTPEDGAGDGPPLLLLLDEGIDDEAAPAALAERVAFKLTLDAWTPPSEPTSAVAIASAREHLSGITTDEAVYDTAARIGPAFGVPSLRSARFLVRAARAHAAFVGHKAITADDLAAAAALVIAPRATTRPVAEEAAPEPAEPAPQPESDAGEPPDDAADAIEPKPSRSETAADDTDDAAPPDDAGMSDRVVAATVAALPPDVFAALTSPLVLGRPNRGGRAGLSRAVTTGGRPIGTRRGTPGGRARLAFIDTLRAAAPWQKLRAAADPMRSTAPAGNANGRIRVRRDDFRVHRLKQRSETLTLFVVDASGSAALNRLAEVKGAVELILADCYVRRDSVALIAFRGTTAELLLPPTRSLTRAKRALAGQPGGGGTPLASALDVAAALATTQARRGVQPLVVLLTDGRGNISRAGLPGREEAQADARAAAAVMKASRISALLIDIAPRPQAAARDLAAAMGARYQPLPFVDSRGLSAAVRSAAPRPT